MQDIEILCLQTDIVWEEPKKNRELLEIKIQNHFDGQHLIVLPETFTTGFPDFPKFISESLHGETMEWMAKMASKNNTVIAGSLIIEEDNKFFNALIWMRPDGSFERYDKRHVFSMAGEQEKISKGDKSLIVELNGWKIKPMICYDLRFPVWCKNTLSSDYIYEYDLAIFIANWPDARSYPWRQLLVSRAIENLAYVAGVNRVGYDGPGKLYSGHSMIIDPKGKIIADAGEEKERILSEKLSYSELTEFRQKFNVGLDWDRFEIKT